MSSSENGGCPSGRLWKSAHELVMQDKEENRSHERKALRKLLDLKMNALKEGKPVPTAQLPDESNAAGSKPAATSRDTSQD